MRLTLLLVLSSLMLGVPLRGELREVALTFRPTECVSCTESLPERFRRIRGVESVELDAESKTLRISLAAGNRVRLSRLRESLEQDGTKLLKTLLTGAGECTRGAGGEWTFQPHAGDAAHPMAPAPEPAAGSCTVTRAQVR